MNKQFIVNLIENWIVAVCENKEEAVLCEESWATAILLVEHRWKWKTYSCTSSETIKEIVWALSIPVFVRIRHWHFAEAKIASESWAHWLVEALKENDWIQKPIDKDEFEIPVISEIHNLEELKEKNIKSWSYYLLLWEHSSWNIVPLINKLKKWDTKKYWKVFIWWWISSPADLMLLNKENIKWYFIWTAIFYFDTKNYFEEIIQNFNK